MITVNSNPIVKHTFINLPDKILLEKLEFNKEVFWTIWNKYKSKVFLFCMKFTKSYYEAEDLIGKVLLKSYKTLPLQLKKITNLTNWFYIVVKHVFINAYNSLKKTIERESKYFEELFEESQDYIHYNIDELRTLLFNIINTLPTKTKQAAQHYFLEEYSYSEISEKFNCQESTIRKRIQVAREKIRPQLKQILVTEI